MAWANYELIKTAQLVRRLVPEAGLLFSRILGRNQHRETIAVQDSTTTKINLIQWISVAKSNVIIDTKEIFCVKKNIKENKS